jgi:cytidine deaminase
MDQELIEAARACRMRAHAPYSNYLVGAALRDENGQIWVGCNVENISFGATICAERVAIGSLIAGGSRRWTALAVVTQDGGTPCGVCRQVLSELATDPGNPVICATPDEVTSVVTMAELLPFAFQTDALSTPEPQ